MCLTGTTLFKYGSKAGDALLDPADDACGLRFNKPIAMLGYWRRSLYVCNFWEQSVGDVYWKLSMSCTLNTETLNQQSGVCLAKEIRKPVIFTEQLYVKTHLKFPFLLFLSQNNLHLFLKFLAINLTWPYTFNETALSDLKVCTNGILSLDGSYPRYNDTKMPFYTNGYGIIAAFWADVNTDVNTNGGGNIWARETTDSDIVHRITWTSKLTTTTHH